MTAPAPPRSRRRAALLALALLVLAALGYATYPRTADLRVFEPMAMARAETALWRDYYQKRYLALFAELYGVARAQQGFSPADSLRIAFLAVRAARTFQPTRSRREAEAARPDLIAYFGLLAEAAPVRFDRREAARRELDWWQARRENVAAEAYGLTIAAVSAPLYGVDNAELRQAGILRAQAMAYRDARGGDMTETDWDAIAGRLGASYRLLKQAIGAGRR